MKRVNQVGKVIELLLKRGANPSTSQIPYPGYKQINFFNYKFFYSLFF